MAGLDLGKPVGPLPLGAWIVVVGAGLAVNFYTRKQTPSEPEIVEDIGGVPGVGTGPGWVAVPPPSAGPSSPAITTNEEWAREAINRLIALGYDAAMADSAVRKYIAGEALSVQEYALIRIILTALGSPPIPLPPGPAAPTVPKPTPTNPTPTPTTPTPTTPTPSGGVIWYLSNGTKELRRATGGVVEMTKIASQGGQIIFKPPAGSMKYYRPQQRDVIQTRDTATNRQFLASHNYQILAW